MKKLLAIVLSLMLFALPAFGEEKEYALYTHPENAFSLEYPAAWSVLEGKDFPESMDNAGERGTVLFKGQDGMQLVLLYQPLGAEMTPEMFMSMMLPVFLESYEAEEEEVSFPDHGSVEYMDDAGDIAYCCFTVSFREGEEILTSSQYFRMAGEGMYILSLTLPANADYEADEIRAFYRTEMMHILRSFTLAPEKD